MKRRTMRAFVIVIAASMACLIRVHAAPAVDGPRSEANESASRWRTAFGNGLVAIGAVGFSLAQMRRSRRELEEKLREQTEATAESEECRQILFQSSPLGVVRQDRAGCVIAMNRAAEQILGRSSDQLVGHALVDQESEAVSEDGKPLPDAEHPSMVALRTGAEVRNVVVGVSNPRERARRWINTNATPRFRPGECEPCEVWTIFEDVTARREATVELARLREQLEARSQALEAANRELDAFSYSVSHDLRAPLRSMEGFSRVLLEDCAEKLDADSRDSLNRICAASHRMSLLIDALLKLSRVSRGEIRLVPVDLSALALNELEALRRAAPERVIEPLVAPGLVATGDARLLELALAHLLGNAVKFSAGRPVARIEFGATVRDGEQVFFVRDNGAGFDLAHASKLFGAFQRFHTTEEFPGIGAGLATVQRVIHRHGGRVFAESEVDRGATFYFSLPAPLAASS